MTSLGGRVPDEPLDALRPGDPAPRPRLPRFPRCPAVWFDAQDDPGLDPPWHCARPAEHRGQHAAVAEGGGHVAAVAPAG